MVHLIGAPFDLCSPTLGSRLGPIAVRMTGLGNSLTRLGIAWEDRGDISEVDAEIPDYQSRIESAIPVYRDLRDRVAQSMKGGAIPLVIGGDHSLAIGSISGALKVHGSDLGVLWIDAHMDMNTPESSPSGNIHGMPLAALAGMSTGLSNNPEQAAILDGVWKVILSDVVPATRLDLTKTAWIGLRDVDAGEVENWKKMNAGPALTMQDVDRDRVSGVMEAIDEWAHRAGIKKLWISFDVDSLDPLFAPGTGTKVRGGLTYREGHLIAELLCEMFRDSERPMTLVGLDVVEVNPLTDQAGETARMANEWVASLFGNTIMGAQL